MSEDIRAFIAAYRFGLGPRPGEMAHIGRDPVGWVTRQLNNPPQIPALLARYPDRNERVAELISALKARRSTQRRTPDTAVPNTASKQTIDPAIASIIKSGMVAYRNEAASRLQAGIETETPFLERLVHFWSNHFTVSVTKNDIRGLVGNFERDAIRPYILGRFEDMLIASTTHAAMLHYLDQTGSIGPNSMIGRLGQRGLNENLAREILELHTLGVDGGYSQQDVTAFAHILTGWTIGGIRDLIPARARRAMDPADAQAPSQPGTFTFIPALHEPGPKNFMGYQVAEQGVEEGMKILRFLARHPATARFIATKMARHFIADDPPAAAISQLETVFLQSGGNLRQMADTLARMPACWHNPLAKVKTPTDYILALARVTGVTMKDQALLKQAENLGQMPFAAPSPAGWPDRAESWIGAESLLRRIDLARQIADQLARNTDPRQLLEDVLGPVARPETRLWVSRAPDAAEGIAMILAAPEFQRR